MSASIWVVAPRKIAPFDKLHNRSLLEKGLVEVGAVNLAVAQGARLEERLLAVERRSGWRPAGFTPWSRTRMALQAQQIDIAYPQHVSIGASVGNVAGRAPLYFYRLVLEDEWPLLVDMARETDRILCRRGPHLLRSNRAVHVVAVRALNQAFIHAMVKRHLELGLLLQMACVAELRLRFHQEKLFGLRMVRRVARDATDGVLAVYRVDGVHVLSAAGMAGQTTRVDFLRRSILKYKDLGFVAAAGHVIGARTVATFATLFRRTALRVEGRLPVGRFLPTVVDFLVTGLAGLGAQILGGFARWRRRGGGGCAE